jgi:hypothetical protein
MPGELFVGTLAAGAIAALLVGCVADSTSTPGGSLGYSSGSAGSGSSSGGSSQPILADIDTNGTLISTPGQGIGVYVTYESGGHWSVSWTCDTSITNLACNYTITASVDAESGVVSNAASPTALSTGFLSTSADDRQVEASTNTTTGTDGMTFDTTPGVIVTIAVQLNAPVSFFFVQDNKVNGGYTGTLTNPMMFQPSSS